MHVARETAASTSLSLPRKQGWVDKLRRIICGPRSAPVTEDHVRCMLALRRARQAALGGELFGEPAWDLLLELYAASLSGNRAALADLAICIDLPETTAGRWLRVLTQHGLIVTCVPAGEAAAAFELSPKAEKLLKPLLDHWVTAFRSI